MSLSIDSEVAKLTCHLQCVLTASCRFSDAPATTHLQPATCYLPTIMDYISLEL